jgi:hypothetical protein
MTASRESSDVGRRTSVSLRLASLLTLSLTLGLPFPALADEPARPAAAMPRVVTLSVQVMPGDDGLQVSEALRVTGGSTPVRYDVPLALPEGGRGPTIAPRSEAVRDGVETKAEGGAAVDFGGGALHVTGVPAVAGRPMTVQVRYTLPIESSRTVLAVTPAMPLERVQVVSRRTAAYVPQVRPLAPYAIREETEEDGTWVYQTTAEGVPAASTLRIAAGHLPYGPGPYRTAGGLLAGIALAALAVAVARGRRGT